MKPSTEHDYRRRIARVIEAILLDPGAPHSVEALASVANLSPFHFHRIYRALTGERVAETVQRLRMAQAAYRLKDQEQTVTAIALDAGYDSPQAFARAFRSFAGVSPSAFRARQGELARPRAETPRAMRDAGTIGAPDVEIVELAPIDALCLRHEGPIATIGQTFRKLARALDIDVANAHGVVGICTGDPDDGDSFRYRAGIAPTTPIEPTGAVEAVRVEGGLYASYRLIGPPALIAPTFQSLFGGWLPRSGYDPDDRPALELYRGRASPRREGVIDLLIPIRKPAPYVPSPRTQGDG